MVSEWARRRALELLESDGELVRKLNENGIPYAAADEILRKLGK